MSMFAKKGNNTNVRQHAQTKGYARSICVLMIVLITALSASAGTITQWQQTEGPEGGEVLSMLVTSNGKVFAGLEVGGVVRSDDNGENWMPKNEGLTSPFISALSVDESKDYLYAGSYAGGVFRSSNEGDSWELKDDGLPGGVESLITVGSTIYAGTGNFGGSGRGVYCSIDDGDSWTECSDGLPGSPPNQIIPALAASGTSVYAAVSTGKQGAGVYRLNETTNTWVNTGIGLGRLGIRSLTVFGTDLYAGTTGGVYLLDNGNWISKTNNLPSNFNQGIEVFGSDTHLYAGVPANGIYRSADGGNSWEEKNEGYFPISHTGAFAASNTSIYAGTGASTTAGVFRSDDGGDSWERKSNGITSTTVRDLLLQGDTLYAGTRGGFFERDLSTGGQSEWVDKSEGLKNPSINAVAALGNDLYVGIQQGLSTDSSVYRLRNGQTVWEPTETLVPNDGTVVFSLATRNGSLYAGTQNKGVFQYDTSDDSWEEKNNGLVEPAQIKCEYASRGPERLLCGDPAGPLLFQ